MNQKYLNAISLEKTKRRKGIEGRQTGACAGIELGSPALLVDSLPGELPGKPGWKVEKWHSCELHHLKAN